MSIGKKSVFLIILILILDQVLKIWVKINMSIGQEIHLFRQLGYSAFY